jgi:hypothetical protein
MTQEALKQMYQLLLTEPHAPTVCAQLERIAREALADHAIQQRLGREILQEPLKLCQYGQEPASCTSNPMDCQCAIDAALAQPEQEPKIGCVNHDCDQCKASPEQEPVAWLLTDKNINSLQVDSIQRLINRLKHAHQTDLCVRINGQYEWFQADWLKDMVRVTPPQRTEEKNT